MAKHVEFMPWIAEGRGVQVSTTEARFPRLHIVAPDNPGPVPKSDKGRRARISDFWNWLGLPIQTWIITSISTAIILTLARWAIALWGPV